MKQTQEVFGFFSPGILAFAVLALSGEAKTSDKVLKKCSSLLAMSRQKQKHKKGISKSIKRTGERQESRQEVSCSQTCGR